MIIFFLLNALFWGLASHTQHCKLASSLGIKSCPPHWIHVYVMGLGSFIATLYFCLLYTSPSPRDVEESRMPSSA